MASSTDAALVPVERRLAPTALIGRDAELARAASTLSSPPSVLVVEGESGIGKTRLVRELERELGVHGRRFLTGWCRPIREPFPLGPVLEAVRGLRDRLASAELSAVAGALRPLLPELARYLPAQPASLHDRAAERHRIFRALVELLAAVTGPVVLVLEDLHWADEQTTDFVRYLLTDPPPDLSVVLTYRSEDVDLRVRAVTARTPPQVRRSNVELLPLGRDGTGQLAAALLGADGVTDGFADDLFKKTSGSPFAIEELLLLLPDLPDDQDVAGRLLSELDVPGAIRDPVLERVARLAPSAQAVIDAAAIMQAPATSGLLATISNLSKRDTRHGLADALASGVLTGCDAGFEFRHPLAAQAVYEQIARPVREDLHDRAASALLAADPDALGQAAYHSWHSRRRDVWARTAERAADRAVDLGHDEEAAPLYEQLLHNAPLCSEHRGRVAIKFARTSIETRRAADVQPLIRALDGELSDDVAGELCLLIAMMSNWSQNADLPRRYCATAVENLSGRPALQAWAMSCLGIPAGCDVSVAEHLSWVERSLEMLDRVQDQDLAMGVVGKAASTLMEVGEPSWRNAYDGFVARTASSSDRRAAFAYRCLGMAAALTGHHQVAGWLLDNAGHRAHGCENPRLDGEVAEAQLVLKLCAGDWSTIAERLTGQAEGEEPDGVNLVRGCLALARGHHDDAHRRLGLLASMIEHGRLWDGAVATNGLIRLALSRRDPDLATRLAQRLYLAMDAKKMWAPLARALPAMTAAEVGGGRLEQAAGLVNHAERELCRVDSPLATPALQASHAIVAASTEGGASAAELFVAAADEYDALRCPYEAAQAREQAAACLFLTVTGHRAGARQLTSAIGTYQELGARWDLDRASGLARQREVPVPARHRGGRRGYGGELSPREAEVARLAGAGRTNDQIAGELFVSVSTVKKHLAAALRKLGIASRHELVHRLAGAHDPPGTKIGPRGP